MRSIKSFLALAAALLTILIFYLNHSSNSTDNFAFTFPVRKDIVEIVGEMNGSFCGLPTTGNFMIPPKYYGDICSRFSHESRKWTIESKESINNWRLGSLTIVTRDGRRTCVAFYMAGKGAIGYSVGECYFLSDTLGQDGASELLFLLEKARVEVGVKPN